MEISEWNISPNGRTDEPKQGSFMLKVAQLSINLEKNHIP